MFISVRQFYIGKKAYGLLFEFRFCLLRNGMYENLRVDRPPSFTVSIDVFLYRLRSEDVSLHLSMILGVATIALRVLRQPRKRSRLCLSIA